MFLSIFFVITTFHVKKDILIKKGMSIIDLGSFPGGWTQVIKENIENKNDLRNLTNSVLTYSDLQTNKNTDYKFDLDKFTSLDYEEFITLQKKLENNSLDDRKKLFNLGDHRADVIVPATKIIERILNKTGIKDLYALNWSLCDAIAFDYYLKNEEAFI